MAQDYQKLLKYGELLLSHAANCRKLQTESEKVAAPTDDDETCDDDETFQLEALDLKAHIDMSEGVSYKILPSKSN